MATTVRPFSWNACTVFLRRRLRLTSISDMGANLRRAGTAPGTWASSWGRSPGCPQPGAQHCRGRHRAAILGRGRSGQMRLRPGTHVLWRREGTSQVYADPRLAVVLEGLTLEEQRLLDGLEREASEQEVLARGRGLGIRRPRVRELLA